MKPIGQRLIIKVKKNIKKEGELEVIDLSQEAKVVESNIPEVKKGDVVYYNPRGCINIQNLETKKEITLIIDSDDVYAKL